MCLEVYANGCGEEKGTHLSVLVKMVHGEFDDQLKWPFRGKVFVKLLNQNEDSNHIVRAVCFDDTTWDSIAD